MKKYFLSSVVSVVVLTIGISAAQAETKSAASVPVNPEREAYFGDLHLHTTYSFDAYVLMGTKVNPDTAYRFAKGEKIEYFGQVIQRREPLDFLAVTDHSENIGVFYQLDDPNSAISKSEFGQKFKAALVEAGNDLPKRFKLFHGLLDSNPVPDDLKAISASAWQREIDFANSNYQPGKFTTFIAYEWTSMKDGANLHRNVFFKGNSAPAPFTSKDSIQPEDLWKYLENARHNGYDAIAIPHNGNASNGLMYDWTTLDGRPIDKAYAELRRANEPLSEISQNKGSSDTHPTLSSADEFANFEIFDHLLISPTYSKPSGSYVRDALSRGLVLQRAIGINPYKDGVEGSSDLHSGLSVSAQADYSGNVGAPNLGGAKVTKEQAEHVLNPAEGKSSGGGFSLLTTTAGNLTGVWAESNTRESIFDALRRKETFATTGTRVKLRFFGGWKLDKKLVDQKDWVKTAYTAAVPMGGDLPANAKSRAPSFAIWAVKDPNAANLDRVQVIKVWEENGAQHEKIFDVAWSGQRAVDKTTGKLPAVGNTVDLKTGQYTNDIGATELKAVWTDPEFDPNRLSAYYLRVLEIPTPRWSTLLAVNNGLAVPKDVTATVQQRAWSSPIWYTPASL